ncbi:MAG: response regulator [Actinobacteria bacterium]|nr:MAG: response regulator [Actinomycetota bacterium]
MDEEGVVATMPANSDANVVVGAPSPIAGWSNVMESKPKKSVVRYLASGVFVVIAGLTTTGFVLTRQASHDQEERLLKERTGEVAVLLTNSTNSLQSTLGLLGEVYVAGRVDDTGFVAAARSLITGNVTNVGVVDINGNDVVIRAAEGNGAVAGNRLVGDRATLARRAVEANGLVSALVTDTSSGATAFVVALGRPDGFVVYQESLVDPTRPLPSTAESPFRSLDVVLYRAPSPTRGDLVITTTADLAVSGSSVETKLKVGSESWLLITAAKDPLGGSLGRIVPWIILGGGLAAALVTAAVIRLLARRREYAMVLVDERTAALRQSLDDLETARAAADSANRSKNAFLSRMSHELRTPLNAVLGFAQVLELDDIDNDQREAVEQILKGGNHLLELINEVLDISRIDSGDLALSPEPVLVSDVLNETLDLMRPLAAQRSIHLAADRRSGCVKHVFADRQRLKQILLNLLSNAVKYNRMGGTVSVSCEQREPTRFRLKVSDTGPGIRPEHLDLLFVPFERLGADRTEVEGTGIGLALSRRLAEAMGGTIDVASTFGQGSTFTIELPLVEAPVDRYERLGAHDSQPDAVALPLAERATVLYIEDNLANLKLVQRVFSQRHSIEIIPALQGRLGIDLARQHHPVLILLDLHLPDIRGDEVLQQLCDDPATASIPVVILSADATQGQQQRLLAAGASAYLTKPLDIRQLLSIVDNLLSDSALSR